MINNFLKIALFTVTWLAAFPHATAQETPDYSDFGGIIYMDSLVVTASRTGFEVKDFMEMVQTDSSFLEAFINIRFLEYRSDNDIRFFNKKKKQVARLKNTIQQNMEGNCRTMDVLEQEITGNYYKRKKKRRYLTAKMYEDIFFTYERTCINLNSGNPPGSTSAMQEKIKDLKQLIFQPGSKVDVPIVGKKAQIFDEPLRPYYDYAISSKKYKTGADCYVFSVKWKEDLKKSDRHKTIIKSLETYFDKNTFAVVARNYELYYQGTMVDFDVDITIELTKVGEQYVPEFLYLEGDWDVPFRKKEKVWFETRFYY
ncbi:MAG: hypothetical protein AB8F74_02720 [Saprospiraceae bacterium]